MRHRGGPEEAQKRPCGGLEAFRKPGGGQEEARKKIKGNPKGSE